jgi:hypothetical protein
MLEDYFSRKKHPISIQWNVLMDDTKLCLKEASMSIVPDWMNCSCAAYAI